MRGAQGSAVEGEDLLSEEEGGEGKWRAGTAGRRGGVITNIVEIEKAHM